MHESECPSLLDLRSELTSVKMQMEVWRDEPDPAMTDRYGVPLLSPATKVAGLECEERELVDYISLLEKL